MKQWSRNYTSCIQCHKTDEVHDGKGICRLCRAKATYRRNKVAILERTSQHQRAQRIAVLYHYSKGEPRCACCGERTFEFLAIDHMKGGGNRHRIKLHAYGKHFVRWLIKNGFPSGYQVLCHNCNMAKGFHGSCPHMNAQIQTHQEAV